jgi:hypothetical protein
MSWHFSRALAVACSEAAYWVGKQSAQSRSVNTGAIFSQRDRTTAYFRPSPSGTMYEPLMASNGEVALMWYREAFPARRIPRQLEAKTSRMIFGRKCGESWQRSLPGTYLPRTLHALPSTLRPMTSARWVTKPAALPFPRQTWVRTTYGHDIGYVHTPTTKANYAAKSMQKWPSCRNFVKAFGSPNPINAEWLMGWPTGWTDLRPLAMGKWLAWQQQHGA